MRRAAPPGTPTHGGWLEAPDATRGGSIAVVVAELCRIFAASGGEGREGGKAGVGGRVSEPHAHARPYVCVCKGFGFRL